MSIVIKKGTEFAGEITEPIIATAVDWTGLVSVYQTYPGGSAIFSSPVTVSGDGTKLLFTLQMADVLNLVAGVYCLVSNIASISLAINTYRMDYLTVLDTVVSTDPMTTLTMTILKADGTPAGRETRTIQNTIDGTTVVLGWAGVKVSAFLPTADELSGNIVGTELVSTTTNAAGYAELPVLKGLAVVVSCPSFGKTISVDTTGLDTIDLSSYF